MHRAETLEVGQAWTFETKSDKATRGRIRKHSVLCRYQVSQRCHAYTSFF